MLLILEKSFMLQGTKAEKYHLAFPDPLPSPPGKEKPAGAWQAMETGTEQHGQGGPEVWEGSTGFQAREPGTGKGSLG